MASNSGASVPSGQIEWGQLVVNGAHPAPRGGHTCCAADGQLVVFGGHCYEGSGTFQYYNDTHVFDTESSTWHAVPCRGELPPARYGHSATLVGSRMYVAAAAAAATSRCYYLLSPTHPASTFPSLSPRYVFGGKGPEGVYRDMHFLDLIEWTWVPVNATTVGPTPRFSHASALVGRKLVVHGGWDGAKRCLDDLWVFDTDNFTWLHPKTGGLAPSKRHGHSLSLLPDGRLMCFGGCQVDGTAVPQYFNDLRQLDTETMVWAKPRTQGDLFPSSRCVTGSLRLRLLRLLRLRRLRLRLRLRLLLCEPLLMGRATATPGTRPHHPHHHSYYQLTPPAPLRYGQSMLQLGDQLVVFGGWGLGGLQSKEANPATKGAETVFAVDLASMTFWAPSMTSCLSS